MGAWTYGSSTWGSDGRLGGVLVPGQVDPSCVQQIFVEACWLRSVNIVNVKQTLARM